MKLKEIEVGVWYETKYGVGKCEKVGGTFPPSVKIMGRFIAPREVLRLAPMCRCHKPSRPVAAHDPLENT